MAMGSETSGKSATIMRMFPLMAVQTVARLWMDGFASIISSDTIRSAMKDHIVFAGMRFWNTGRLAIQGSHQGGFQGATVPATCGSDGTAT